MNPLTYQSRPCRPLPSVTVGELSCKNYVLWSEQYSESMLPEQSVYERLIRDGLSNWHNPNDHMAAFAITHFANDGCYFLVSRWNDANMLRHRVFSVSSAEMAWTIEPLKDTSIIACVWELKLMMHERDLWINEVLQAPDSLSEQVRIQNYMTKFYEGLL